MMSAEQTERRVIALGVFDGLHRGHVALLERLNARARESGHPSCVVTFDPHPARTLNPSRAPRLLMTFEQRREGILALGVDEVYVVRFDEERARQEAMDFVREVLVDELAVAAVLVGEGFRFGHARRGSTDLLEELGQRWDFEVEIFPTRGGAVKWSSSSIRAALDEGDVAEAARVLGRFFGIRARVAHGDARGRELGFPTANLEVSAEQQLPRAGIYAGAARVAGRWWPAAISVGTRPQFYESGTLLVEVHLIDFVGDLYDQVLEVAFTHFLRDESRFEDLASLVQEMSRDVARSRDFFDQSRFEE